MSAPVVTRNAAAVVHADRRRPTVDALIARGAVAVVRLGSGEQVADAVAAIAEGGLTAIELTMTTPGALRVIASLARDASLLVGAGSVLNAEMARQCIDAGARFVVSPVFDPAVLEAAHSHDVPVFPGAFTPTEMLHAYTAGADLVKVFPADTLGPSYLKGVLAPMPFLELMPTGGVTPENAGTWIAAGAVAVGLGGSLIDARSVSARDWATLTARARTTIERVREARVARGQS